MSLRPTIAAFSGSIAEKLGAGEGNRTLVCSLGSCRSAIELHPQATKKIKVSLSLLPREIKHLQIDLKAETPRRVRRAHLTICARKRNEDHGMGLLQAESPMLFPIPVPEMSWNELSVVASGAVLPADQKAATVRIFRARHFLPLVVFTGHICVGEMTGSLHAGRSGELKRNIALLYGRNSNDAFNRLNRRLAH